MKILDIDLVVFEDYATGDYGLCPKGSEEKGFNAFWNGIGIFHDVFEHWFEDKHKYFSGEHAFNVCGEMCAMGAAFYYYNMIGSSRALNPYGDFNDAIMRTTIDMVHEAVSYGYCDFGAELKTKIPNQKRIEEFGIEYYLDKYIKKAKKFEVGTEDYERGERFKNSVSFSSIANPHRYGYRMAEKLVPNTQNNFNTLSGFIKFFNDFCKGNTAEEFSWEHSGINVKVFREQKEIRIKAYAIKHEEGKEKIYDSKAYQEI